MKRYFDRLSSFVVFRPWWTLLLLALLVAPFAYFVATRVSREDNSSRIWFPGRDMQYAYYDHFRSEFESDELVTVGIEAPAGIFRPEILRIVEAIESELSAIPDVEEVRSLLSMDHVRGVKTTGPDGESAYELLIRPVVPPPEEWTEENLRASEARALSDENLVRNAISADGTFAAVFGRIIATDDMEIKKEIVRKSKEALGRIERTFAAQGVVFSESTNPFFDPRKEEFDRAPVRLYLAGTPIFDYEFDRLSRSDQVVITALTLGVIFLALLLLFRSALVSILPILVMSCCLCIAWGGYLALGGTMNMLLGMSGPVLIAACVGESVHVIASYYHFRQPGGSRQEALIAALHEIQWPCFFTAFTTAIGFASFAWAYVPPMQAFGACAAVGALFSYIFAVTAIPAAISTLDDTERALTEAAKGSLLARLALRPLRWLLKDPSEETISRLNRGPVVRMLDWLARFAVRRRNALAVSMVICFAVTIWGVSRLRVESNNLEFLPNTHYVRYAMESMQQRLGGLSSIELVIEGEPGGATDPAVLARVDAFVRQMKSSEHVTNVISHTTYLKQIHKAMNGDDPAFFRLPESRELVAQYLLLAELSGASDLDHFFNYDYSAIRLTVRSDQTQSSVFRQLLEDTHAAMARHLPDTTRIDVAGIRDDYEGDDPIAALSQIVEERGSSATYMITGMIPLYGSLNRLFVEELLFSFFQAFLEIYLCMVLLTRSIKMGAIAMLPNLLPIFVTGAVMGLSGWRLDPATILIASIALGIAVDDTVHYVSHFPERFAEAGRDYGRAIWNTHVTIGRALVATSIVLVLGFGVMVLGSFSPTQSFGVLTAMTMVFAVFGDVVYLPVLYLVLKPLGAEGVAASEDLAA